MLILSSYFVVVAHDAVLQKNPGKARMFITATLLLGIVFLRDQIDRVPRKFDYDILRATSPRAIASRWKSC